MTLLSCLTRLELQCVQLTCQGLKQKAIAHKLGLSDRTVEKQIQAARYKLRAKTIGRLTYLAGLANHFADDSGVSPETNVRSIVIERIVVDRNCDGSSVRQSGG